MIGLVLAVSAHLFFNVTDSTGTDSIDAYQTRRCFRTGSDPTTQMATFGPFLPAFFWKDSARTIPKVPLGIGPDDGWCYVDDDSVNVMRYQIAASFKGRTSRAWEAVLTKRLSDVTLFLQRPGVQIFTDPRRPEKQIVAWSRAPNDTGGFQVRDQAYIQNLFLPIICAWPAAWRRAVVCP